MIRWSKGLGRGSLAVLCLILFLTFLDNTIVSVVLAGVQSDLSAGVQDLQWIVDGYMLTFAALMLTGGTLGDLFGRKKIMLSGVVLFSAGSAISLFAPSVAVLTAGRVIMGIGAAASEPGTLSMIRQIYPDQRRRARALAVWTAVSAVALAFGPIIGGLITGAYSWRGVFLLSLVLGVFALIAGALVLPESSDRAGRRLDARGLILGAVSIIAATFAVIRGETDGYGAWYIIVLFVVAGLTALAFLLAERRHADPVLKLKFFRSPLFTLSNFTAFSVNFGVFAIFFFTALYLQIIAGFSGYQIALSFVTMALAMIAGALFSGRWLSKTAPLLPLSVGSLLAGGGVFAVNGVLTPDLKLTSLAWPLAVTGLGFGIALTTSAVSVLAIVPQKRSGMAASTLNTSRELGGVFGVAILGSIVNGQLTTHLTQKLSAIGLPDSFQSLVIYATTHGGNTPPNIHVNASKVLAHPALIQQITNSAYQAFGDGLTIALRVAGILILATALITSITLFARGQLRPIKTLDSLEVL
ncbi:MAG TPA: MFS transporter [Candidatus Saccharimonadales bacterium]|nr:MFS transporter [Candidatus Saccharimonadales bacterium]